jgi:hypothetical protein
MTDANLPRSRRGTELEFFRREDYCVTSNAQ